jgi:hypothetical protein
MDIIGFDETEWNVNEIDLESEFKLVIFVIVILKFDFRFVLCVNRFIYDSV